MNKTEIKKELYKQNPVAYLRCIKNGVAHYHAKINESHGVLFDVPVSDMGDAEFKSIMEAKLLIRWML